MMAEFDAMDTVTNQEGFELSMGLYQARLEKKLTQTELAQQLGMKQAAIARLESGKSNPTYQTLVRVAEALDRRAGLV